MAEAGCLEADGVQETLENPAERHGQGYCSGGCCFVGSRLVRCSLVQETSSLAARAVLPPLVRSVFSA